MTEHDEQTVVGTIEIKCEIRREMVDDILTTAFEGGIDYWCERTVVVNSGPTTAEYTSDVVSCGGSVWLVHDQDMVELTLDKFVKGLERYCKAHGQTPEAVYEEHDALVADEVVQYAVFNEVIYG